MTHNERLCINCNEPMKKVFVGYKGVKLEARQCPKCKEKIFTEDLAKRAINRLEARRLEPEYVKHPIKIGHSWGVTFPKVIAEVFGLSNSKTALKMHPDVERGKIEILLGE